MKQVNRLSGLDGLRGIAALAVVGYHYEEAHLYYGLLGVELFFVISGFVILMTVEKIGSLREFALHRVARLYPAYWLSVIAAGGFLLATGRVPMAEVAVNATMLQGFFHQPNLVDPYWTLSYELWFYAVVAMLFTIGVIRHVDRVALIWLVGMIIVRGAVVITGHGHGLFDYWLFRLLFMPMFGHLFIAGMMLYRLRTDRSNAATCGALVLALLYSAFGRPDWTEITPIIYLCTNTAFIAAVWFGADRFSFAPMSWIGRRSYSLYLLHDVIFMIMGHSILAIGIGISAAAVSWRYIERPAQLWIRTYLSRT